MRALNTRRGDSGQPGGVPGAGNGTRAGSGTGSGTDDGPTSVQFNLPKNGQFGAVVVGASLEAKYPELSGVWSDRVAYTVYLHVGLSKSWILQYSLPRSTEAQDSGNVSRLEAPWPYNIVRPNLAPDSLNADALLVHGYVNEAGKFESLGVAFPPEFPGGAVCFRRSESMAIQARGAEWAGAKSGSPSDHSRGARGLSFQPARYLCAAGRKGTGRRLCCSEAYVVLSGINRALLSLPAIVAKISARPDGDSVFEE